MKILLAEDSAVYRHLITGHLKEWGFTFVIAKDGAEAWNLLQKPEAATMVLLDWVLPELDGLELCRKIRQAEVPGGYTYTILLTAKDGKNDLLEGMEAGADDYLVKPFEPLELRARLLAGERILNLQRELVDFWGATPRNAPCLIGANQIYRDGGHRKTSSISVSSIGYYL